MKTQKFINRECIFCVPGYILFLSSFILTLLPHTRWVGWGDRREVRGRTTLAWWVPVWLRVARPVADFWFFSSQAVWWTARVLSLAVLFDDKKSISTGCLWFFLQILDWELLSAGISFPPQGRIQDQPRVLCLVLGPDLLPGYMDLWLINSGM